MCILCSGEPVEDDVRKGNPGAFHVGMMQAPSADPLCELPSARRHFLLEWCRLTRPLCSCVRRLPGLVPLSVLRADRYPPQGAQLRHEQLHVLPGLHGRHRALRALGPLRRVQLPQLLPVS